MISIEAELKGTRKLIIDKCKGCKCVYNQPKQVLSSHNKYVNIYNDTKRMCCIKYWSPEAKWANNKICPEFGFMQKYEPEIKKRIGQQKQKKRKK